MNPLALGPLVGVLLVIALSGAGIALARLLGGDVHEAITQVYGAVVPGTTGAGRATAGGLGQP